MVRPSGIVRTSSRTSRMRGSASTAAVSAAAKRVRSTARHAPAGTRCASAMRMTSEPSRRISSLRSPTAVSSVALRNEFEQTSSPRRSVWCAGVRQAGRISQRSTSSPARASCQAASDPASPPPITVMRPLTRRSAPHAGRRPPRGQRGVGLAVLALELLLPAAALADAAAHRAVALGDLFGDEGGAALGAGHGDRPIPGDELAVGVAAAAEEDLPPARDALEHLPRAAAEAGDARRLRLVQRLHVGALGIPRAAEELAEAAEADLHGPAALLAPLVGDLGRHRLDRAVWGAGEVLRVLAGRVAAAGEELASPSPLDHQLLAALLAGDAGRPLLPLDVAHVALGPLEVARERLPEPAQGG